MNFMDVFRRKSSRFIEVADLPFLGAVGSAGKAVTKDTALQVGAVFACVRAISDGVAHTPMQLFRKVDGGRELINNRLSRVLTKRPNSWQTKSDFIKTMTLHATLMGGAFAFKNIVNGELRELLPLMPSWVQILQSEDMEPVYRINTPFGLKGDFTNKEIFYLPGISFDGFQGLEIIKLARNAISLAIATEEHHAKLHANGGQPQGILSTDKGLVQDQIEKIAKSWRNTFSGSQNAFKTAVLDNGMKFQALASSGVDNQHIETRRFQIEEVCRMFNVFPQIVMSTANTSTYASASEFFTAHVRLTLHPWMDTWRERIDEFILDGSGPLFIQFDTRGMTQATLKDRAVAYRTFVEMGIYTRNEIREMEGLQPLDGLDDPLTPMNMEGTNNAEKN